ncbi:hypothetical protein BofuT4_uP133180.1 [Botrytis cinerea T4]|uniref:Uncharacterized protein n=1 Tax=Botryotinia fuckeliana (strain T4) TaxID=999810 RepID=G2YQ66_BOTF4|nr:hypothetical protein BofuT4_uP133180.1 [Botrytis cinerea T4]
MIEVLMERKRMISLEQVLCFTASPISATFSVSHMSHRRKKATRSYASYAAALFFCATPIRNYRNWPIKWPQTAHYDGICHGSPK